MKYFKDAAVEFLKEELFYGSLPEFQSKPLEILVDTCLDNEVTDVKQIAYVLATAYHESNRFKAKEEYRKGHGRKYGQRVPIWNNKSEGFWGRGWVQLTWLGNYGQFTALLSALKGEPIDLINNPEKILEDDGINAYITVVGMKEGLFTGKKMGDYLGSDYIGARRVVNGTDKAGLIAGYAEKFEEALRYGQE